MTSRIWTALAVCVGLSVLCTGAPQASENPPPTRVAVVNISQVMNTIQETKQDIEQIHAQQDTLRKQQADKQTQIQTVEAERGRIKEGTPQYDEKTHALLDAQAQAEAWYKVADNEFQRDVRRRSRARYAKIKAAVSQIARERHVNLVIQSKTELPNNMDNITIPQLLQGVDGDTVLYADEGLDLTQDVIALLDRNFKAIAK
jgi:Skp family chaperone for outer membrane proteins